MDTLNTIKCPECRELKSLDHLLSIEKNGLCEDCKDQILLDEVKSDYEMDIQFNNYQLA